MAATYTALYYHIVFSPKNRTRYLKPESEPEVWAYIGGVARTHPMSALQIGGDEDHIHALVMARARQAPSQIAQYLKGDSSKGIRAEFSEGRGFGWQDGYGAFPVSRSNLSAVIRYIQNQRAHHRQKTFPEEYLELLQKHGIEYDVRYLWG